MRLYWILFLFTASSFAAITPPLWRINLDVGYGKMNYIEDRNTPSIPLRDIDQKAMSINFSFLQYLLAPDIDLTAGAQIFGINISEPEDENLQFQSYYGYLNLGFNIYTFNDYVRLRLVLEGFNQNIISESNLNLGFKNLWGAQAYPDIEILPFGTDMFMQISPFVKIPLLTDSGKRKEFSAGLKIKIPTSFDARKMKFPAYAYQTAFVFKIFYRKVDLLFKRSGFVPIDIKTEEIVGTFGLSF